MKRDKGLVPVSKETMKRLNKKLSKKEKDKLFVEMFDGILFERNKQLIKKFDEEIDKEKNKGNLVGDIFNNQGLEQSKKIARKVFG